MNRLKCVLCVHHISLYNLKNSIINIPVVYIEFQYPLHIHLIKIQHYHFCKMRVIPLRTDTRISNLGEYLSLLDLFTI